MSTGPSAVYPGQLPGHGGFQQDANDMQGQSYNSQSRRAPSTSSIASSSAGTVYSSARGSVATSAGGGAGGPGNVSSSSRTGSSGGGMAAHLETTVTKLLVATKQLLEGLTDWSQGRITEEEVSDIYVRLGNCFNAAVAAFTKEGINMRDLKEVPSLLRVRLEDAINEEASRETLNKHLPKIRPIVLELLRGLRQKQEQHAALVAAAAVQAESSSATSPTEPVMPYARRPSHPGQHASSDSMASSSSRLQADTNLPASRSREDLSTAAHTPNGRASPAPSMASGHTISRPSSRNAQHATSGYQEGGTPPESSSGRRIPYEESTRRPSGSLRRPGSLLKSSSSSSSLRPNRQAEGTPPDAPLPPLPPTSTSKSPNRGPLPLPGYQSHLLHPPREEVQATPPVIRTIPPAAESLTPPLPPSTLPFTSPLGGSSISAFATPPRSALRPMNPPVKEANDPSLEALKKSDPLARRASKRFSAYTFNKISSSTSLAGSPSSTFQGAFPPTPSRPNGSERDNSAKDFVNSGNRTHPQVSEIPEEPQRRKPKSKNSSPKPRHRDIPEPPVPALPPLDSLPKFSLLSEDVQVQARKKRVSVVTEETEEQLAADGDTSRATDMSTSSGPPPTPPAKGSHREQDETFLRLDRSGSAVSLASSASQYSMTGADEASSSRRPSVAPEAVPQSRKTVFLQLGRDMKKATLDDAESLTFASLRMLFTERFAYNPGMTDFPAIYLRDPQSGVQYELEDVNDIQDRSVLSLNIEPLDQVKQHIDEGLASLARELKDLKASLTKRASMAASVMSSALHTAPLTASPSSTFSPQPRPPPSEAQIQQAAEDVLSMKRLPSAVSLAKPDDHVKLEKEKKDEAMTSPTGSTASQSDARLHKLAAELKSSYNEVQTVRREIGALRQVYLDFRTETGTLISGLKAQATRVKEIAETKVAGERAYIDEGKVKLDNRSQDLLTKIEELQDTIDDLKNDVVNRKIKPKPRQLDAVRATIKAGQADLDSLSQYIATVKPMWKKTWEAELQNIVDEQQLLNHQEELLSDLQADHENVVTVFEQIEQYVSLQSNNKIRRPEFRPPSPEQGHQGLKSVMMEVKGLAPASDKRMRAIEMAEKIRLKEVEGKTDEFTQELSGFVEGKLLKKTGGAEEIERIRQMKSEASLRAMFNQTAPASSNSVPPVPPLPASGTNPGLGLQMKEPTSMEVSKSLPIKLDEHSSSQNAKLSPNELSPKEDAQDGSPQLDTTPKMDTTPKLDPTPRQETTEKPHETPSDDKLNSDPLPSSPSFKMNVLSPTSLDSIPVSPSDEAGDTDSVGDHDSYPESPWSLDDEKEREKLIDELLS